jgi:hypothetical protein
MILISSTLLLGAMAYMPASQAPEIQSMQRGNVIAETWTTAADGGLDQDWYRLSLDGGVTFGRDRATHYRLELRHGSFDPLRHEAPAVAPTLTADTSNNQLWIVQYIAKGAESWREELRALGGTDHRFLGMHANIWQMSPEAAALAADLPFVRWVGPFHPAYKLENELLAEWKTGAMQTRRYNIVVGEWGPLQKSELVALINQLDGSVQEAWDQGWIVSATLNSEQLKSVVHSPLVLGIDRWSAPETDMDNVRNVMGGNYVETVGGFTGQGVRAEVMDSGLDTSHADWVTPPILHTSTGSASHGTCTYGINFAGGGSTAGGQSRGMMPDATGIFANYGNYGNRYTHTAELVNPALTYRAVYQSNSWGDARTTQYTSKSQELDDIIFINDFSILQSQSNAGNQDSRPQAWAKNMISVGGVRHNNDTNIANDNWSFGGSIGPAQDGRIKPDIAAYYDWVWTSDADSGGYVSGDDYNNFGGTSAATPIVAGHLGLIYQMWGNGVFGNVVGPGDIFDNRPHNTTAKALLLNSTKQWTFSGTGHDLTRVHQGWGMPDLQRVYDNGTQTFVVNEEVALGDQGAAAWDVTVPAGAPEFRATMVYSDRAGTTSSSLHRINDLSMRVTDPAGNTYWGNNGLLASMTSTTGGASNTKDTVEQVIVSNPTAGIWKVEIFADEVNQDSHLETGGLDADFALVVTPVTSSTGTEPTNTMGLVGYNNPWVGLSVTYSFTNAQPNAPVWMLASQNLNGSVYGGHDFDLGAPVTQVRTMTASATGDGDFILNTPASLSGTTWYLEVASVSGGVWSESAPLQVDIR